MIAVRPFLLVAATLLPLFLLSQEFPFAGTWTPRGGREAIILEIEQMDEDNITGTLLVDGLSSTFSGKVRGITAEGHLISREYQQHFKATLKGDVLNFVVAKWEDENEYWDWTTAREYLLVREEDIQPPLPGDAISEVDVVPVEVPEEIDTDEVVTTTPPVFLENREEPAKVGVTYSQGTRVMDPFSGVSFLVPPEWQASIPGGSAAFTLSSAGFPGTGIIILSPIGTREGLKSLLFSKFELGEGNILEPTGDPIESDNGLRVNYVGLQDAAFSAGKIGPEGNLVAMLFAGPARHASYYESLLKGVFLSVRFVEPIISEEAQNWLSTITGSFIISHRDSGEARIAEGVIVSETRALELCSDGSYALIIYAGDNPESLQAEDLLAEDIGQWNIQELGERVFIILKSHKGRVRSIPLAISDDGEFLVDGEEITILDGKTCE